MRRLLSTICLFGLTITGANSGAETLRSETTFAEITRIEAALTLYRGDTGQFPSTEQGLHALIEQSAGTPDWRGPYLRNSPTVDSWGEQFLYEHPPTRGSGPYDLYSKGVNSRDDLGLADDITSWSGIPLEFYPRPFPWTFPLVAMGALAAIAFVLAVRKYRRRSAT